MPSRILVELIDQARSLRDDRLHRRILAVEHAQGIAVQAPHRIRIELVAMLLEILDEPSAIARAGFTRTERVQLELDPAQAELPPQARAHHDMLDVDVRSRIAERLDAELMKLTVASFLRPFVPEHGTAIPQALRRSIEQVVLDHSPHARSRSFGTQRQAFAVELVDEGIHLFFDDVGHLTDRAHEELGALENRHADLAVTVRAQPLTHR